MTWMISKKPSNESSDSSKFKTKTFAGIVFRLALLQFIYFTTITLLSLITHTNAAVGSDLGVTGFDWGRKPECPEETPVAD